MIPAETGDRRASWKTHLLDRLHDPLQLRIVLIGVVMAAGYAGVYLPLSAQIADRTATLQRERKMAELAETIEQLQTQCRKFEKRLPQQADSKEWMQYMLDGVHGFPLKLSKLDCPAVKRIGPFHAVVLTIELEGSLYDLDRFLRWLETNPRLLRTDDISITLAKQVPTRGKPTGKGTGPQLGEENKDELVMKLTVLGLAG